MNSNEVEYSIAQTDDSWITTLDYLHSSHEIVIDLDITVIPQFIFLYHAAVYDNSFLSNMLQKNND